MLITIGLAGPLIIFSASELPCFCFPVSSIRPTNRQKSSVVFLFSIFLFSIPLNAILILFYFIYFFIFYFLLAGRGSVTSHERCALFIGTHLEELKVIFNENAEKLGLYIFSFGYQQAPPPWTISYVLELLV